MIINEDCRTADPTQFTVLICDPPYSAHVHKNATSNSPGRGVRHNDLGFDPLTDELRDTIASMVARVRRWGIVYSDFEGLHAWRESVQLAGGTYIRPIPWVRWSSPQLSGDRPPTGAELITCYWGSQKGRKSWNGPGNLTHFAHKALRGEGKHKTEKPLDQALDLVAYFSNPGDRVLDPCAGRGTVGLACKILGRDYVGYEIDPVEAEKARVRIESPTLSDRDAERLARWEEAQAAEKEASEKRRANTARVRTKHSHNGGKDDVRVAADQ